MKKQRLDQLVLDRGLAHTQSKAQALILAGEILVDKKRIDKVGELVCPQASIELTNTGPKFVSRGGIKLSGALEHFRLQVNGFSCLDVGSSTGGFTDCLLQRGAKHVFAIDVGRGQLDPKIRQDPRVTWRESFHVRNLTPTLLERHVDLAVVDVSFISLRKVLPFVVPCLATNGLLLALIKPQFEASQKDLAKGGVLKDQVKRKQIIEKMLQYARDELFLKDLATADAAIPGPKGNREAFLFCKK